MAPGCDTIGRRVPCRRHHLRAARQSGCVQSDASCVAARRLGDQRRRVRGAHSVRTRSAAQLAWDNSIARIVGCRPGGLRTCSRGKCSCAGRLKPPTLPRPRARDLAGCDGAAGVWCRASVGRRASPSAAERLAELLRRQLADLHTERSR